MAENEVEHEKQNRIKAKVNIEEPSEELLEWAKNNINEDPDTRDLLISELKDMIYERGECTPSRMDDEFILGFLRARHFNLRIAHRLYVNHSILKEEAPQYFDDVNLDRMVEIVKEPIFNVPPNRDHLGRRMLIFRIGEWRPSEFTPTELLQFVVFLTQITLLEPQTQIKGAILLVDLSGLSLEMVWYLTPTLARHVVNLAASSFPVRLEAVHFLYTSWIFDTAYNIFKVFIPERFRDRIHFHNNLDTLYDDVDPKYLPNSLGGAIDDYTLEDWMNDAVLCNKKVIDVLGKAGYPLKEFLARRNNNK
ncbi:unnamed protein product [Psylliodes chrysocephalus]|nr:unnamed protein product [Psylliodes chrysocephala]